MRGAFASVADLTALVCVGHINRFWQLGIWTIFMLLAAAYLQARYYWVVVRGDASRTVLLEEKAERNKNLIVLLLMCYVLVMPVVFSIFVCRDIDGVSYLVADYTLRCHTPQWRVAAAWSAIVTAAYAVGFPLFALFALWSQRPGLAKLFAIVEPFFGKGERERLWLAADLLKKLCLSAVILTVPEGSLARITTALLFSTREGESEGEGEGGDLKAELARSREQFERQLQAERERAKAELEAQLAAERERASAELGAQLAAERARAKAAHDAESAQLRAEAEQLRERVALRPGKADPVE
eukprot:g5421.t1